MKLDTAFTNVWHLLHHQGLEIENHLKKRVHALEKKNVGT